MFFSIIARDKPGMLQVRQDTKSLHMAHLDAGAPGVEVLQSGPLLDEGETRRDRSSLCAQRTAAAWNGFLRAIPMSRRGSLPSIASSAGCGAGAIHFCDD